MATVDSDDSLVPGAAAIAGAAMLLLAVLAGVLVTGAGASAATTHGERVGVWRYAETDEGNRAVPDGNNASRGAARLSDGRVLVVGGFVYDGASNKADVYDPDEGTWTSLPEMRYGRRQPEVVALSEGRAFVAGGAHQGSLPQELYDPSRARLKWLEVPPAPLDEVRTATRLDDDSVLATGVQRAAVFDAGPQGGTWTSVDAPARPYGSATRMPDRDGDSTKVLAVHASGSDTTAELYDPDSQAWEDITSSGESLAVDNEAPLLAGLDGGGALVVSGDGAFRYDLDEGWTDISDQRSIPRNEDVQEKFLNKRDAATRLEDGSVLLTGKHEAELFLPDEGEHGEFLLAGYAISREKHTATSLEDGRAVVTGGTNDDYNVEETDLYYPPSMDAQLPPPALEEEVAPTVDLIDGGVEVTIDGSGFSSAKGVFFGEQSAADFEVRNHGRITATAPAVDGTGRVTIRVETSEGVVSDPVLGAFDYVRRTGIWAPATNGEVRDLEESPNEAVEAAVLDDGKVVIFSDTESSRIGIHVYDPRTGTLEARGDVPFEGRYTGFAPLSDGRVLVLKQDFFNPHMTAALYDPEADEWTETTAGAPDVEFEYRATLLDDGRVLVLADDQASLYDPAADVWRTHTVEDPPGGTTNYAAITRLEDGRVLVAGGGDVGVFDPAHRDARIFDPESETWSEATDMSTRRGLAPYGSARLDAGGVLVAGGTNPTAGAGNSSAELRHSEVFDPDGDGGSSQGAWNDDIGKLQHARSYHTLTKLADGSVLAAGGLNEQTDSHRLRSAEVYRPERERWEPTAGLIDARRGHAAVALSEGCGSRCGSVLVIGGVSVTERGQIGDGEPGEPTRTLELYTPRPRVDSVESARGPLDGGDQVTITGQFFAGVDSVSFGGVQSDEIEVVSQTEIVAEVPPAGSNGPVPVTVTNDVPMGGGQTEALASFRDEAPMFTYVSEAGRVDDLTGQAPAEGTVKLSWSAVDDGTASPADEYVVAQSVEPIGDAGGFADAFALCGGVCDHFAPRPQAIGDPVTLTVEQLQPGTTYHYAVAPIDADGERGLISDAVSVTTLGTDSGEESPSDDDGTAGDGRTGDNGGGSTDHGTVDEAAEAGGGVVRLAGADRIATSVEASREAFNDGEAGAVVLARADEFADGLAGVPLARVVDGPLLLTHSGELDDRVAGELQRLLAEGDDVWMLGGRAALNEQVEQRVTELGFQPQRLAGNDRFETAAVIAEFGLGAPDQVLVATGGDFADAVTAGAAASQVQGAVVLSAGDQLPAATSDYLAQHDPAEVFAVGGPAAAAVPDASPLVGATRFETAAAVADQFFAEPSTVGLATGMRFPDALSGGSHIARYGGPMLLSGPDRLHSAAEAYLAGRAATIDAGVVYGGTAALTSGVADGLAAAIAGNS